VFASIFLFPFLDHPLFLSFSLSLGALSPSLSLSLAYSSIFVFPFSHSVIPVHTLSSACARSFSDSLHPFPPSFFITLHLFLPPARLRTNFSLVSPSLTF
jgi:hypothetical protein